MTSTLTRTSQAVAEWSKVFPRQATETYTSSVTFIKQLTVVAVSTITYLKNAFPEDNYTIDQFGGLKIRVLKNKCEDELAQFLITALTQAFEAFDKKYLHQIALCFYENECAPENLVEYHLFEYGYGAGAGPAGGDGEQGGATVSVRSAARGRGESAVTLDAVRDRTVQLLRACMVMLSHSQLPETYDVSLRLYYNDDAPEGYQAPGFSAAREEGADALAGGARVKLGSVTTPFHRLQLHTHHRDLTARTPEAMETTPTQSEQHDDSEIPASAPAAGDVQCECGRDDRLPDTLMRTCRHCGTLQHAVCYGSLGPARGAGGVHCCVPCAGRGEGGEWHTDPGLQRAANRTCYAIFRRALWHLDSLGAGSVSAESLGGALGLTGGSARKLLRVLRAHGAVHTDPPTEYLKQTHAASLGGALGLTGGSARKLLRVLRAHGAVHTDPPTDPSALVSLVPAQLKAALARYFLPTPPPSPREGRGAGGVAARLLQEAQCEESPDPLTEVLSPLERVSLQATANSGCMVSAGSPPAPSARQDSTLAQYRSALAPLAPPAQLAPPAPRKRKQDQARKPGVRTKRVRKGSRE